MKVGSFRVVIAGGGVGALEAMLALRDLAGDRVSVQLVSPDPSFRHRPLSVTEPFGLGRPRDLDLAQMAAENGASFVEDAFAELDVAERRALMASGRELPYDAFVLAIGARAVDGVPGATTFRDSKDDGAFRRLLFELDRGTVSRVAFAVPGPTSWPLGLYELALLTAAHVREPAQLTLVTPESRPMELFGAKASEAIAALLARADIELRTASRPLRFDDGRLELAAGASLSCDRVVALPRPTVDDIPGVPQGHGGFVPVDRYGAMLGLEREYAVGDVTWFPIKQGGLAAQQADCAATAIAALAGGPVDPQPFRPVLRGALLTDWGPRYMRAAIGEGAGATASRTALWWPPAKVAGRYLAPYLMKRAGYWSAAKPFADLDAPTSADLATIDSAHDDLVQMALGSADADAAEQQYGRALKWLEVVEDLELYLPHEYELKRRSWDRLKG